MAQRPDGVGLQILRRMKRSSHTEVWTAREFVDLGTRTSIDVALHRLAAKGAIRRIHHGLYDIPRIEADVVVPPEYTAVLAAISRSDGVKVLVDGHSAAYRLGLTHRVPAKLLVLTSAQLAPIPLGRRQTIYFKTVAPSRLVWAGRPAAYFVEALRFLRKDLETGSSILMPKVRAILDDKGGDAIRSDLERGLGDLPIWLIPHVKTLLRRGRSVEQPRGHRRELPR